MNNTEQPGRRFSRSEISAIIAQATRLKAERSRSESEDLTMSDLEEIAAELGLSKEVVHSAIRDLDARTPRTAWSTISGKPFSVENSTSIDRVVSEDEWMEIVNWLQKQTGRSGELQESGSSREWVARMQDGGMTIHSTRVTLTASENSSVFALKNSYEGGANLAYLVSFVIGATLVGIGLDGSGLADAVTLALVSAGGVGGLAAARASVALWAAKQKNRLRRLADMLEYNFNKSAVDPHHAVPLPTQAARPEIPEAEDADLYADGEARTPTRGRSRL